MGKPTGFMEFEREINPTADPLERIKSFDEFHGEASIEDRRRQGARCMNCGVAFCPVGGEARRNGFGLSAAQSHS